jgi:RNA 2',3'-cyclic 3'-phosphodiesterase
MEKKRLFFGTFIDNSMFQYTYEDLKEEFSIATQGKFVELANLHFTYFFLGETDATVIPVIKDKLKNCLISYDESLLIKGMGVFPRINNANVLFANVFSKEKLLIDIYKQISKVAIELGFPSEKREYTPHLTLQRIKQFKTTELRKLLNKYKDYKFGFMDEFSVHLIESKLTSQGPIYKIV